ncbi:MAG: EF-hand domain-containing protein [Stenotrophomonas sp.]
MRGLPLFFAPLLALLPALALAQAVPATRPAPASPVQTQAVPELPVGIRTQALAAGEQTGRVEIAVAEGDTPVSVRSVQPDSVDASAYRIAFATLDTNADGFIDRDEAAAHPALHDEFKALDVQRRGKLDRADLAGWLID